MNLFAFTLKETSAHHIKLHLSRVIMSPVQTEIGPREKYLYMFSKMLTSIEKYNRTFWIFFFFFPSTAFCHRQWTSPTEDLLLLVGGNCLVSLFSVSGTETRALDWLQGQINAAIYSQRSFKRILMYNAIIGWCRPVSESFQAFLVKPIHKRYDTAGFKHLLHH